MLQLHWPPTFGWQDEAYLDAFRQALDDGIAKQTGLSNFGPKGIKRINTKLAARGIKAYTNQVRALIKLVRTDQTEHFL